MTAGADSSGKSVNTVSTTVETVDKGSDLILLMNITIVPTGAKGTTHLILAKTSLIEHAVTQSTVQRVLSSSSSDGSGGSSAA